MRFWKFGAKIGNLILRLKFVWYDLWIGAYYSHKYGIWYLAIIPTIILEVQWISQNKHWGMI